MMESCRQAFREEAGELLATLENSLIELDKRPQEGGLVDEVFRALHTLKGSSAMVGFDHVAAFIHELETVFDLVRNGTIAVSRDMVGVTLRARDQIRDMIGGAGDGREAAQETLALLKERLELPPAPGIAPAVAARAASPLPPSEEMVYRIRFRPAPRVFLTGADPSLLLDELRELGPCRITVHTGTIPPLAEIDPEQCHVSWEVLLTTGRGMDAVREVFIFVAEEEVEIDLVPATVEIQGACPGAEEAEVASPAGGRTIPADAPSPRDQRETISSIRVAAGKLDHLVNLVGELVTVQARLSQTAASRNDGEFLAIAEEVERLTSELRDTTMNMRMLPIGGTFNSFKRLVHDLAVELGKDVVLTTDGGETELDKTVLEKLSDPLGHLIRNCMDHGIEHPSDRLAAGKPRQGTIHLSARHSGDSVLITVSDDGAGLDREAIRARGVAQGMLPAHAELADDDIYPLIFAPGFSTARRVTSISGRGVGMDVVKRAVDSLRASISVKSSPDVGTTITLRIPLTLAIIESLLVQVGDERFVLPLALVEECVELTRSDAARTHGRHLVSVRDQIVPYIRLRERFRMGGEAPEREQIVVTEVNGRRVGLVVDYVIGEHQTVIKSLGRMYRDVGGFAGATILGDGSVGLILDVPQLIETEEAASLGSWLPNGDLSTIVNKGDDACMTGHGRQ